MQSNTHLGILYMVATTLVFALQDGFSQHLSSTYNVYLVVMIRYWFFAAFVATITARQTAGIKSALKPKYPILQIMRGIILAVEICVMVTAFTILGLIESHAVFACYPLLVAALSGPILGEYVGWRRWAAISIGFIGVLIILQPGLTVFSPAAVIPLISAFMFALYGLMTRYVARGDSASTSFFWTGIVGVVVMTIIGISNWEPMSNQDYVWMALLCVLGALGHFLLIKCFEVAEASSVQPFAYLQLVFASGIGMWFFEETLDLHVAIGALIVVSAGLFTLWRSQPQA